MNKKLEIAVFQRLLERFGTPVGMLPPGPLVGVRDERELVGEEDGCSCGCDGTCGCEQEICVQCGSQMDVDGCSGCGSLLTFAEAKSRKKKGPSKKTAKKILKGTKSFKEKVSKVSSWAENPEAAAAWMQHKATGKWPSEE